MSTGHTLEKALLRWYAKDFWQLRTPGQSWENYVHQLVRIYDEVGMWHVLPQSVLGQRDAWRTGKAKAEYVFDEVREVFVKVQ